jgi:predicted neuraminidase
MNRLFVYQITAAVRQAAVLANIALLAAVAIPGPWLRGDEPLHASELIFPLNAEHNHAPGVVECSNGDLIVSWYRGSGERRADDVLVLGSRLRSGSQQWSPPFLMVDTPGFPDCNTCLLIDQQDQLWLFWPTILANTWESCLTNFLVASDYTADGPPVWKRNGLVLLKPDDFSVAANAELDALVARAPQPLTERMQAAIAEVRSRLGDKLYQRLGWQPRCKPTVLHSGRFLLPLYTDTFSVSIMAISDDGGLTWRASAPLLGFGAIQPAVVERRDGTVVAYMRENGVLEKIRVSQSSDGGETWGPVGTIDLPNPGSGLDAMRLDSGRWLLVYNDRTEGRNSLAVSLSEDEGLSWKWTRHLENEPTGAFHYPAVTQGKDGRIHLVYSYFVEGGKSMKHVAVNEAWIMETQK